jgi:hypothetical protein
MTRFGRKRDLHRARGTRRWRRDLVLGCAIMVWVLSMWSRAMRMEMETTMTPKRLTPKMNLMHN